MKAQNLSVSLPYMGCNKDPLCEYCISHITGFVETNYELMRRNIPKIKKIAESTGITTVLLTSKGEPFLDGDWLETFIKKMDLVYFFIQCFNDFPLEIQTNGIWLNENKDHISKLQANGLDVIAFSIDDLATLVEYENLFELIKDEGMLTRVCINLTSMISEAINFEIFMSGIKKYAINQLLIRHISYPSNAVMSERTKWIDRNANINRYERLYDEMITMEQTQLVRILPHGAEIYDVDGIAVSFSDWCIQEINQTEDIRSLVFLEDGHLYTSWNNKGSIIF